MKQRQFYTKKYYRSPEEEPFTCINGVKDGFQAELKALRTSEVNLRSLKRGEMDEEMEISGRGKSLSKAQRNMNQQCWKLLTVRVAQR